MPRHSHQPNPKVATVQKHPRFKAEYGTNAQAEEAKPLWEEKGRILRVGGRGRNIRSGDRPDACERNAGPAGDTFAITISGGLPSSSLWRAPRTDRARVGHDRVARTPARKRAHNPHTRVAGTSI